MSGISVVIADRHPVVLHGLMSLLGSGNDFDVVASCLNGTSCLEAIRKFSPDIALLDLALPDLSGFAILHGVRSERLPTRIVFLAAAMADRGVIVAAARGGDGVVFREASPESLVSCLYQVAAGERVVPINRANDPLSGFEEGEDVLTVLTHRERQIAHLVSKGLSNKQIGRELNISDGTIKVHLHRIYQKLAISNRTALALRASDLHRLEYLRQPPGLHEKDSSKEPRLGIHK